MYHLCQSLDVQYADRCSFLTNAALDENVQEAIRANKRLGMEGVRGQLKAMCNTVQRERVGKSMERADPVRNAMLVLKPKLQRSKYAVTALLSLWNMDGNHGFIRLIM